MEDIKQKIPERLKDFLENNFEMLRVFDVGVEFRRGGYSK